MGTTEREVLARTSLTRPDGTLNPAAVGWMRMPLLDTDGLTTRSWFRGRRWGRAKRWEYWAVTTPTHVVALTISSLDYAGVCGFFLLDRASGQMLSEDAVAPLARGVSLPGNLGSGHASFVDRGLQIRIDERAAGSRLRGRGERIEFDVMAHRPAGHDCLGVVVPWSDRLFQYTVKDPARPATGWIAVGGQRHPLPEGESWATLDHGRGRWPYAIRWNWGAGSGLVDGRVVGLQVGGRWTDGTGSTENGIVVDGHLTKIGADLTWTYDRHGWLAPWQVRGPDVDLIFTPEHLRVARTNLGLLANDTHQCFGTWSGEALGQRVDGLYGWAEDVANRW